MKKTPPYRCLTFLFWRQEFDVIGTIASARFYICDLGLYERYLNGLPATKGEHFAPTVSDYDKCVYITTHMTSHPY